MRIALLAAVAAALACAGCEPQGGAPLVPTAPSPAPQQQLTLSAVAGSGQSGTVHTLLPVPLQVAVRDTAGRGVAGILVQFAVVGTNATLDPRSGVVVTDRNGRASVSVRLGRKAEPIRAAAASAGALGVATFSLVATPSPVQTMSVVSGDSQFVALPGARLEPLVVAVHDSCGNVVSGRRVVFRVVSGTGAFGGQDSVAVATDSAGTARATMTSAAPAVGDTVRVIASGVGIAGPPLQFMVASLPFRDKTWGAGPQHACAIAEGGQAYCWGDGTSNKLGNGGTSIQPAPVPVTGGAGFLAVRAGGEGGCGLTASGAASCWGSIGAGGSGLLLRSISVPSNAVGVSGSGRYYRWGAVPTAYENSIRLVQTSGWCGLTASGEAHCWVFSYGSPPILRAVPGGLTFRSLSAGNHSCGLTPDGAAWCWGNNGAGQLGDGSVVTATAPVRVAGGLTFSDISVGAYHTCGVTAAGAAYCWGDNGYGQLGTGTSAPSGVPAPVAGGIVFASVSAGGYFTCGIAVGGAAYCWGYNLYGQLGTGTPGGPNVLSPAPVVGGLLFRP